MLKSHLFQESLRTSASEVSLSIYDEQVVRQPPEMIRQNKFTKTYAKLTFIPLQSHISTLIPRNIQHLYLSHNNITSMQGIENYHNLVSLNLSYNRLNRIQELKLIQNPDYLMRIGLKMNDFVYGYQDYAIKMFPNLQKIDDICVKDKLKVKQMWERGQKIGSNFLQFYIRLQRVLNFMNELVSKTKLHQQMGLSQGKSKYPTAQLKLLFEHMTPNFIAKVSQHYMMPSEEEFLHLSSLEMLKKISIIIQISLSQKIDFKCTCRPKLLYDQEVKQTFQQICDKFLLKFSTRYNKELEEGLKKIKTRISSLYPSRNWQNWELYGMLQNYLELGAGGKKISCIVDQQKKTFVLFEDTEIVQSNFLKGKKPKKDDGLWRNALFSDFPERNEEQKENESPNVSYWLQNFQQYKARPKKRVRSGIQEQEQKIEPELHFDRIPMVLYEKNYIEILMEISMGKIKQMLENYDFLVQKHTEIVHSKIKKIESIEKSEKEQSFKQKIHLKGKLSQYQTKRTESNELTQRNISGEKYGIKNKQSFQENMLKSTIANNTPFYTERLDEGAVTTTRHYLKRKDSEISFGRTNQDENEEGPIEMGVNDKKREKAGKNQKIKKRENGLAENYSLHQINLAYKVLRGLKLRVIKRKKKEEKQNH